MRVWIIESAGLTHRKVQYVGMLGKAQRRPQHVVLFYLKFRWTRRRYEPRKRRTSTVYKRGNRQYRLDNISGCAWCVLFPFF